MGVNTAAGSRAGVADAVVVVSAVLVVVSSATRWAAVPVAALAVVSVWLWRRSETHSASWVAAITWTCVGAATLLSFGLVWPIPQLFGLGLAAIVLRAQGTPRPEWFGRGRSDRVATVLAVASVPLTTLALVAFIASGRTDLESAPEGLQSLPGWVIPLAGLGFVLANPTVEEVLFRGALQTMVAERLESASAAIVVQGVAFGAIHLDGVPGGVLGAAMAAVWGVVLGVVRHRMGSIRTVWVVHVLANVAIFTTVTTLAFRDGVL